MTTDKRPDPVFDELVKSAERLTDEELEAELAEDGETLAAVATRTRANLLGAIAQHQKAHRADLDRERAVEIEALARFKARLPRLPAARRSLLADVLKQHPSEVAAMTAQFRNLDEMTETDIESTLMQLAYLGLVGDSEEHD
jgi:hypothetical protein